MFIIYNLDSPQNKTTRWVNWYPSCSAINKLLLYLFFLVGVMSRLNPLYRSRLTYTSVKHPWFCLRTYNLYRYGRYFDSSILFLYQRYVGALSIMDKDIHLLVSCSLHSSEIWISETRAASRNCALPLPEIFLIWCVMHKVGFLKCLSRSIGFAIYCWTEFWLFLSSITTKLFLFIEHKTNCIILFVCVFF